MWPPAPVVPRDAEMVVATELRALLGGVYVGRDIPATRRPQMVAINRDGGAFDGVIDRPRLRVRVWDQSALAANTLARTVVAQMYALVGKSGVVGVQHLSGPYEVPDEAPETQMYLMFELAIRGGS